MVSSSASTPRSGVYYFSQDWKFIGLPGIRCYVFLPLLVSVLLMGEASWWLFTRFDSWIPSLMSHMPGWLQWLNYLLWPMVVLSIPLVLSYFFSTIANWIAAPFSGLLAEQFEACLIGATPPNAGVLGIMKDTPRITKYEWQKLAWHPSHVIVPLLLYSIPDVGQTVAPVLRLLFSAWMLAIQYCDYLFGNHKVSFRTTHKAPCSRKVMDTQFRALTSLFTMIPMLNLVILPMAICGAAVMWVDCYCDKHAVWKQRRRVHPGSG